jgi:hypothetical protein
LGVSESADSSGPPTSPMDLPACEDVVPTAPEDPATCPSTVFGDTMPPDYDCNDVKSETSLMILNHAAKKGVCDTITSELATQGLLLAAPLVVTGIPGALIFGALLWDVTANLVNGCMGITQSTLGFKQLPTIGGAFCDLVASDWSDTPLSRCANLAKLAGKGRAAHDCFYDMYEKAAPAGTLPQLPEMVECCYDIDGRLTSGPAAGLPLSSSEPFSPGGKYQRAALRGVCGAQGKSQLLAERLPVGPKTVRRAVAGAWTDPHFSSLCRTSFSYNGVGEVLLCGAVTAMPTSRPSVAALGRAIMGGGAGVPPSTLEIWARLSAIPAATQPFAPALFNASNISCANGASVMRAVAARVGVAGTVIEITLSKYTGALTIFANGVLTELPVTGDVTLFDGGSVGISIAQVCTCMARLLRTVFASINQL